MSEYYDKLIFELSSAQKSGYRLPEQDVPTHFEVNGIPSGMLRDDALILPNVSEPEAVRHYTRLSQKNYGVDGGFYPLGSCTMKYNPKINEDVAALEGFCGLHPYQPESTVQGALALMYDLGRMLSEITGMAEFSLQPAAGAHGELAGLMIFKAWHEKRNDDGRGGHIVPPQNQREPAVLPQAVCSVGLEDEVPLGAVHSLSVKQFVARQCYQRKQQSGSSGQHY